MEAFTPGEEATTRVAVWRGAKGAHMQRLDPVEFVLLQRLRTGGTLEEIFAEPVEPEPTTDEVSQWFSEWQSRGWITARGSEVIELVTKAGDDWSGVDKMGSAGPGDGGLIGARIRQHFRHASLPSQRLR